MNIKVLTILMLIKLQNIDACKETVTTVSGTYAPQSVCSGDLIFEDNFDTFDLDKWNHEQTLGGGGNWEFQWYTNNRNNSYVKNGNLHIRPTLLTDEYSEEFLYTGRIDLKKQCTNSNWLGCCRTGTKTNVLNPVKSARVRTLNSFSFKYGKVEVRAKLPAGDWLWPAIWMLPTRCVYGGWPTSGETDIVESRGNRQLVSQDGRNIGVQKVCSTLNWGPTPRHNQYPRSSFCRNLSAGYDKAFHKYQLEWTANYIQFSIDDQEIGRVTPSAGGFWDFGELYSSGVQNPWINGTKMTPYDQEFHIIINLAVGGMSYFPDNAVNIPGKKPWTNISPVAPTTFWQHNKEWFPTWKVDTDDSHLQVDYVRVWAL